MPHTNGLTQYQLHALEVDAMTGRLDRARACEVVEQMASVLYDLLDEAAAADEEHGDIDALVGTIERLEKQRKEAVASEAEKEQECDDKIEEVQREAEKEVEAAREIAAEVGRTADEWKRRAELAEHELETTRAAMSAWKNRAVFAEGQLRERLATNTNIPTRKRRVRG